MCITLVPFAPLLWRKGHSPINAPGKWGSTPRPISKRASALRLGTKGQPPPTHFSPRRSVAGSGFIGSRCCNSCTRIAKAFFNPVPFSSAGTTKEYPKESLTLVPFNANLNCTIQDLASWWCVCRRTLLSAPSAHPWEIF